MWLLANDKSIAKNCAMPRTHIHRTLHLSSFLTNEMILLVREEDIE